MPKMVILAGFWKCEACGQTVLPDRSVLIGQKLVENTKFSHSNAAFWVICENNVKFKFLPIEIFELLQSTQNVQVAIEKRFIVDLMRENLQATAFNQQSLDWRIREKSDKSFVQVKVQSTNHCKKCNVNIWNLD